MSTLLQLEPVTMSHLDWPLFEIPVHRILDYISDKTGMPVTTLSLHNSFPEASSSCPDWQLALGDGLHQRLHINLGNPGVEEPGHPIEENAVVLYAALLLGWESIPVILSGELEIAVEEGLIPEQSLRRLRECFPVLD